MRQRPATRRRPGDDTLIGVLAVPVFAFSLMHTMIIPVLPTIRADLGTTSARTAWLISAYSVVAVVAMPIAGNLGDRHGKRRVLVGSLVVIGLGALLASLAPDVWTLTACRALQGLGAGVIPLSLAIVKDEVAPGRVGFGIGLLAGIVAAGGGFGLVVSGVVADTVSWRWLFAIGAAAIGLATIPVLARVPESTLRTPSRLDLGGAVTLSLGLAGLLVVLTEANDWGWASPTTFAVLTASAGLLAAWVRIELRTPSPMVDVRMLARRGVLLPCVILAFSALAIITLWVLVPAFVAAPRGIPADVAPHLGYGFDASVTVAGLYLLPSAIATFMLGTALGVVARRPSKWHLVGGLAVTAVGLACLVVWHDEPWQLLLGVLVVGVGTPLVQTTAVRLVVENVKPTETGVVVGLTGVMRMIGQALAAQTAAAILALDTIGSSSVPRESAYVAVLSVVAALSLAMIVLGVLITPVRAGRRLRALPAR